MGGRPWTPREIREMCELRRSGLKVAVVAKRLGRPLSTVTTKLSLCGVVLCPHNTPRSPRGEFTRRVRKLLAAGWCVRDIAEKLGVEYPCVCAVRKRLGFPPAARSERVRRSWEWRRKVRPARLAEMVSAGMTRRQMADEFGCHPHSITRVRRQLREAS